MAHRIGLAISIAVLGVGAAMPAGADKWAHPERSEVLSGDGRSRLTIVPARDFAIGETAPLGTLERKGAEGGWNPVWIRALVNREAPVDAVVADGGRFVVTLDEHGAAGSGENDLVVYGTDGRMLERKSLADLFSEQEIAAFPRSVTSTWWRCGAPRIEPSEPHLILPVPLQQGGAVVCAEVVFELPAVRRLPGVQPFDPAREGASPKRAPQLFSRTRLGPAGVARDEHEARRQKLIAASPPLVRAIRDGLERDTSRVEGERAVLAEVERLVAAGADVNVADPNGDSALSWALRLSFANVARFLVERGASFSPPSARGESLLGHAIPTGDAELVRAMLARGASPDELPNDHHTPLTLAATFEQEQVLDVLLAAGADPNQRGESQSPLEAALWLGWWRGAARLAAAGADSSHLPPDLRLLWGAERSDAAEVLAVLAAKPRFDPGEEVIERALCRAGERGDADMIRLLLSQGADPNRPSGLFRTTPLLEAAKSGRLTAVDALLSGGARVNDADAYGFRALDVASLFGRDEVRRRLLAVGAAEGVPVSALAGEAVLRPQPRHR